jgi:hypothetical protein
MTGSWFVRLPAEQPCFADRGSSGAAACAGGDVRLTLTPQ